MGRPKATPQSRSGRPGQAEDETAPARQHRTADRLAEKCGARRVQIPAGRQLPSAERSILSRVAEGRSGRNADARSLCAQRNTPVGRVALAVTPPLIDPRSYSNTLFPHPLSQGIRASVGSPTRTGGQPRGACGEGGTTGAADLLSAGHSPHPLAWSQAPSSQSCAAAGRPSCRCAEGALAVPP